jgi:hypothetical protein
MPGGVVGDAGVDVGRNEPEVRGGHEPRAGVAIRLAPGLELLQVGEVAHVDLGRKVAPDRGLQSLPRLEPAAGKRPRPEERLLRSLPEKHLENTVPNLEDGRERFMGRLQLYGRLRHQVID